MANISNNLYEFGDYRLNEREKNLWRNDEIVPLPSKVLETLLILVQNAGNVVSKEQMLRSVWAGSYVEESNLSQNIYTLRQLLGRENTYIETVPRRGYRFVGKVSVSTMSDSPPVVTKPSNSHNFTRTIAASVLLLAIAFVAAFAYYSSGEQPVRDANVVLRGLTDSGTAFSPTISSDGRFVAFLDRSGDKPGIKLMDVDSRSIVDIKVNGNAVPGILSFSPDDRELYFRQRGLWRSGQKIFKIPVFGGTPIEVVPDVWGAFGLSPDGRSVAFFRENTQKNIDQLIIRDIAAGTERVVTELSSPNQFFVLVPPAWSPDGQKVAVVRRPTSGPRSDISVFDTADGTNLIVRTELSKLFNLTWQPDGLSLVALSKEPDKGRQIFRIGYPSGSIERVTNDLNIYEGLSFTKNGKTLVTEARSLTSNVWLLAAGETGPGTALTSGRSGHFALGDLKFATEDRVIFDGRAVVDGDLSSFDIAEKRQTRLTENNGSRNGQVTATTNGKHLYISSNRSGSDSIWRLNQDGSQPNQITKADGEIHWYPVLSHDEKHLYYLSRGKTVSEIRRIDLATMASETIRVVDGFAPQHFFQTSPDGKWLAFAYKTNDEETTDVDDFSNVPVRIGLLDLAKPDQMITFKIRTPRPQIRFTYGAESFDYIRDSNIVRQMIAEPEREPKTVISIPGRTIYHFDWSPARTQAVVAYGGLTSDIVLMELP